MNLKQCLAVPVLSLLPLTALQAEETDVEAKSLSGMSVLGNSEAPRSLVIVPWKSSEIGDGMDLADALSDRALPVDREVFARELRYFEIRSQAVENAAEPGSTDRFVSKN